MTSVSMADVSLFGDGESGAPTVAEWAVWADENGHEILIGIGGRVPRRYLEREWPRA